MDLKIPSVVTQRPFDLILLDRDGVINLDQPNSVKDISEFHLIESSLSAIVQLNAAGIKVALVTNQAVVGRGELSLTGLNQIHDYLQTELKKRGGQLDQIFTCTDITVLPLNRRKPAPGMILEAMAYFNIEPVHTLMIGDDLRDLQAAQAAHCFKALVKTGKGIATIANPQFDTITNCYIFQDLAHCVDTLLKANA